MRPLWLPVAVGVALALAACGGEHQRSPARGEGEGEGPGEGEGEGPAEGEGEGPAEGEGEGPAEGEGEGPAEGEGEGAAEGEGEGPDLTRPKVVNVFSPDGRNVTVHFDEAMDPETASAAANYRIEGNDASTLGVLAAQPRGEFVALSIDPGARIDGRVRYTCHVTGVADLVGNEVDPDANKGVIKRTQYLAIVWHQHQPLYHDPARDELIGPWVRKHCTKDYWDMAAIVGEQPDVHVNINLTPVLLNQLSIYLDRLGPYVDAAAGTIDAEGFLARWQGHTDQFLDLLLLPTPEPEEATNEQILLFYKGAWATVSTSDPIMQRFPEYVALRDKNRSTYTRDDFLHLKVFFELAWFDPDFLLGPVELEDGSVVDLSDVLEHRADGTYVLRSPATEALARRLVVDNYKIMKNVVPVHRRLLWDPEARTGQIEVTTTPFFHPILPLVHDTSLAAQGQPFDPLPNPAYSQPEDANAQVAKAVRFHTDLFGKPPRGMWPGEGSVAEPVVEHFVNNGISWIATDQLVMERSGGAEPWFPYRVDVDGAQGDGGDRDDELMMVFRDAALSDKVGFSFQTLRPEEAAEQFMGDLTAMAPRFGADDRLVTVILDGENAWENYTRDHDGKGFLRALYRRLQESYEAGEVVSVAVSEYIDGNPARNVPEHPIHEQRELEPLWAGSWIGANFAVWIGEGEENQAWQYMATTRGALARSGLPRPNPSARGPAVDLGSRAYWIWRAWEELYAAEGSDWFWWYGADMTTPGNNDTPFDRAFRSHLTGVYEAVNRARALAGEEAMDVPEFAPIVQATPKAVRGPFEVPPVVDGQFLPNESEWDRVGGFFFDSDSPGAILSPDDDLAQVFYGYDEEALYVAGLFNEDLSAKVGTDYQVRVYLPHKHITDAATGSFAEDPHNETTRVGEPVQFFGAGAAREVMADFSGAAVAAGLAYADGAGGWDAQPGHGIEVGGPLAGGRILELRVPFVDLGQALGDPLEIVVEATGAGARIDAAPTVGSKVVFEDVTNLVYVQFEADVTAGRVPLDSYVQIRTPPPPQGQGIVYLSGNHDKLDNWNPNSIALRDDGTDGDRVAEDRVWTKVIGFPPGTILRYKYTIGLPTDEGRWPGTEEFPLTERGLDVPLDPEVRLLRVRDTFADRPQPSGTVAPGTVITENPEG